MIRLILSEFRLYVCNHIINKVPSHTIRLLFHRKVMRFKIGKGSTIPLGCTFDCKGNFQMGENSVINANCRIDNRGGICVADNVSISQDCILLTADHDMNSPEMSGRQKSLKIEKYVWIGTRAMILPGANLKVGCVAAAGSVVTKQVESCKVVAGIPARVIGERKQQEQKYIARHRRLFQ